MVNTLIPLASEAAHEPAGAGPYLIGIGTFLFLLLLLVGLVAFGGGREHT
jgi:hypothetical protein